MRTMATETESGTTEIYEIRIRRETRIWGIQRAIGRMRIRDGIRGSEITNIWRTEIGFFLRGQSFCDRDGVRGWVFRWHGGTRRHRGDGHRKSH